MASLPTELTAEYDRLVMLDDWEGVQLLLSPLIQSDDAEALYLWSMSSLPSEAEDQFHSRHLALLLRAAQLNYAPAQFTLGMYHLFGDFLSLDKCLAAKYFESASGQGYPSAQYEYGLALLHGVGVPQDAKEGARLIRAAASAGNETAQEYIQSEPNWP